MKLAFLGAGNMAAAMVEGLIAKGAFARPGRIACMGGTGSSAASLSAGGRASVSPGLFDELTARAGTLVVAFKPQHLAARRPAPRVPSPRNGSSSPSSPERP